MRASRRADDRPGERIWTAIVETIVGFALFVASGIGLMFSFALAGSDAALGDPGVWLQLGILLVPVIVGAIFVVTWRSQGRAQGYLRAVSFGREGGL